FLVVGPSPVSAAPVGAGIPPRRGPGEDRLETALLVYAPQFPWVIPPALAAIGALSARRTGLLLANLLVLGVALSVVADLHIATPPPHTEPERIVRILTWNLHSRLTRTERMRELITQWDPDIVCVQEARYGRFRDLLPGYEHRWAGDARIFSRFEITRFRRVLLGPTAPRMALVCDINTDAGPLTVMSLHFPRASKRRPHPRNLEELEEQVRDGMDVRRRKFEALLRYLPEDRPLVVAGDMNTPPASRY
ncbi:MAG: endonuclease/exonuclease/phosphatase family protein, partial [Armatimonadetes bacterium]|nr:endonuclease/exonuclease/phosphatase family protein [Armatimonadota bacterium]